VRLESSPTKVVAAVPLSVQRHVERAIERAGLLATTPLHGLPFPAMGHQRRYTAELVSILRSLQSDGILS
jgi:hypothetical protein